MPYVRESRPGRWQAVYRDNSGRRHSRVFGTKTAARKWALDREAAVRSGDHRDPAAGRMTVRDWHARWWAARVLDPTTLHTYESRLRLHVLPTWGPVRLDAVTKMGVQAWVRRLVDAGAGVRAIQQAHMIFASMLQAAVDEGILRTNPARGITLPQSPARLPRFFDHDTEFTPLLDALSGSDRVLVDLACHVGLRWGELAILTGDDVDWLRGKITVTRVLTPSGPREYPKSKRSRREVPVPPHVLGQMSALMVGRPRGALLFPAPRGGYLRQTNWRRNTWIPALRKAGVAYAPPHTMRHTAASWLAMDGVDLGRIQQLLGHESYQTTQRYAHLAPSAHDAVTAAWSRLVDAPVTHGLPAAPPR